MALMITPRGSSESSSCPVVVGVVLRLVLVFVVLQAAFGLPAINAGPNGVPVAVVAPASTEEIIAEILSAGDENAFEVSGLGSTSEAEEAILARDVYGAFVVEGGELTVLTASAAGAAVAALLRQTGQGVAGALHLSVGVQDLRPFTEADPNGVGLTAGALPLALGGWIAAVAIMATVAGARQCAIAAFAFAMIGGIAMTAVLRFWFGTIEAACFWPTVLGAMLSIVATSFTVLGLQKLFGRVGMAIAVVILIFFGAPLSGLASAPSLLPSPWGAVGQLLPPGAAGTLLRNLAFFEGAATLVPIAVLSGWLILGLGCYLLGVARDRRLGDDTSTGNGHG